jgi:hypothetical protein
MKDSTILFLSGLFSHFLVLVFAVVATSIIPLAAFSIIGTALIAAGFKLAISDK